MAEKGKINWSKTDRKGNDFRIFGVSTSMTRHDGLKNQQQSSQTKGKKEKNKTDLVLVA